MSIELEAVVSIWTQCEGKSFQTHQKLNPSAPVIQSIASSSFNIDKNIVSLFFVDLMFGDYLMLLTAHTKKAGYMMYWKQ